MITGAATEVQRNSGQPRPSTGLASEPKSSPPTGLAGGAHATLEPLR